MSQRCVAALPVATSGEETTQSHEETERHKDDDQADRVGFIFATEMAGHWLQPFPVMQCTARGLMGKHLPPQMRNLPDNWYSRSIWKNRRRDQLQREPLCQPCLRKGVIRPAVKVHHLVEFGDD